MNMTIIGDYTFNSLNIMKGKGQNPINFFNSFISSYYLANISDLTILTCEIFKSHLT